MPPPEDKEASVTIRQPKLPSATGLENTGEHVAHLALVAVGNIAHVRWVALAQRRLRRSQGDLAAYVAGIGEPVISGDHVSIALHGEQANRIEQGRPQIDMRTFLLGPNVRVKRRGDPGPGKFRNKAGGYYRPIPLPDILPSTAFRSVAARARRSFVDLGQHLHHLAKKVVSEVHVPSLVRSAFGPKVPDGLRPEVHLRNTSDPMARLYKAKPPVVRAKGGGTHFRTISTTTGGGWIMRPKPGLDIMPELKKALEREVPPYLEKLLAAQSHPPSAPAQG